MATLKSHGKEIGRMEFPAYVLATMSDGHILRNDGYGWKLHKHVKSSVTPKDYFDRRVAERKVFLETHPLTARFQEKMQKIDLKVRARLIQLLGLLGNDSDGIWSELDSWSETRSYFSFEEIVDLHRMYALATSECTMLAAKK